MKLSLVPVLCSILLMAQSTLAQSFEIIQNGKNYLCQEKIGTSTSSASSSMTAECEIAAKKDALFNNGEAIYLCAGVYTTGAADCAIQVTKRSADNFSSFYRIKKHQIIELCAGAQFDTPSDCARFANGQNSVVGQPEFDWDLVVSLCKKNGTESKGRCLRKKYNDVYFDYMIHNGGNVNAEQTTDSINQAIRSCN